MTQNTPLETRAYEPDRAEPGIAEAMHDFLATFEEFKHANDSRLAELESTRSVDILTTEKLDRINTALDEQKSRLDRLALTGSRPARDGTSLPQADEQRHAFNRYVRSGDTRGLLPDDAKSLSAGSDPDGGYLAPQETERLITAAVRDISSLRQIASVRQIGANNYRKPVSIAGAAAGWVGETANRPETASPTLAAVDFPVIELYAMPAATQVLLDDAIVDLERWIADEVQAEFAAQESAAFVNGDGNNTPRGFRDYTQVTEGSESWGQLGYIATGVDGDFGASPLDTLVDLIYTPKRAYRPGARFVMNRSVLGRLRKFKDNDGNYLWQPSLQAGGASTLLGYPVTEVEEMPGISAGSDSIAFGDFARGYLIVDRVGVRVLRDPFSVKPYVLFYTTKRVGGGVQDFAAIKLLKFSAN
ncbi:phage major capsid protein [Parvularcula sp. IMCC14364]|uniref:phage major capsid protein n=1 Tax=Parvularcula sp. IMCC14364 TaxID=3067902 RepID=UPI002740E803|nr:phage major capsid protein [Parvularcula sp. IMCC14364]